MFSDPISVTVDSVAKSMPRISPAVQAVPKMETGRTSYATADGTYALNVRSFQMPNENYRVELILHKRYADPDALDGRYVEVTNGFGVVFEINRSSYNSAADVASLRSALLNFVDTGLTTRVLGGEM